MYMNAVVFTGDDQMIYQHGHIVTYMCITNYASATNPIQCTCDVNSNPSSPSWICSPTDLESTCIKSKWHDYNHFPSCLVQEKATWLVSN